MEEFRPLDRLCDPDERWSLFCRVDIRTNEVRPRTVEDHYQDVLATALPETVPEDIRNQFQTARNLLLYSWMVYPFMAAAEMVAYSSLEFALRERLRLPMRTSKKGKEIHYFLPELLDIAIERKLLTDKGFAEISHKLTPGDLFVDHVREILPHFRNTLAHGQPHLTPFAFTTIRMVAAAITQIFDEPTDP